MKHVGMDVHKRETQFCIIDSATGEMTEQRIRTERGRFKEILGQKEKVKVLLEASPKCEWVAECLEELVT